MGAMVLVCAVYYLPMAAHAAGPSLPPAPYKPLPVGTVLDYGKWKCTVEHSARREHVCRGAGGDQVTFYGKFVPAGKLPRSGYLSGLAGIWCTGPVNSDGEIEEPFQKVIIEQKARAAIDSLWPLTVGKEIAFERDFVPTNGEAKSRIRVVGTKTVTIGGTAQQVYVLEGETRDLNCDDPGQGERRGFNEVWWYNPALGAIVHFEIAWVDTLSSPFLDFKYDLVRVTTPSGIAPMASLPDRPAPPRKAAQTKKPQSFAKPPVAAGDKFAPLIDVPATLETDSVIVRLNGKITDQSGVVEVTLNGTPVKLDGSGGFRLNRGVPVGTSRITIAATDEWGNRAEKQIIVTRKSRSRAKSQASLRPPALRPKITNSFAEVEFGTYHALVIGNNKYRHVKKLKTASNDAISVANLLRTDYGFRVTTLLDATRGDILGALSDLRATLTANDNLLIYYAGHGVVDDITEQGYWLPVDAEDRNPTNWVSNTDLTNMLSGMSARHVMVVADSCYSGTLVRAASVKLPSGRDKVAWVKRMLRKRARTALVSGGLEPVQDGGGGSDHSVFAKAFLSALSQNESVMDGQALFDAIKRPVVLNADQTPQYTDIRHAGHDGGEFMFVRKGLN